MFVRYAETGSRYLSMAPSEFQSKLEQVFAPRLVQLATSAFVRACYGYRGAAEDHLAKLRLHIPPRA